MTERLIKNAMIDSNGKAVLFFIAHSESGETHGMTISMMSNLAHVSDDEASRLIDQVNREASTSGIKSMGLAKLMPMFPDSLDHCRRMLDKKADYMVFGPSIGKYLERDIPSFVEYKGRRFEFSGVYQNGMKINFDRQIVDSGLVFDDPLFPREVI